MAFKKLTAPSLTDLFVEEIKTMILTGQLAIGHGIGILAAVEAGEVDLLRGAGSSLLGMEIISWKVVCGCSMRCTSLRAATWPMRSVS